MNGPKDAPPPSLTDLRRRAEDKLQEKGKVLPPESLSQPEAARLIHELRVHQMELEMQNEELRQAQVRLEETSHKYSDLYDFAPVGYLTLDERGVIQEANLTACTYLGLERIKLLGRHFPELLPKPDRRDFRRLLASPVKFTERQGEFYLQGDGKLRPLLLNMLFLKDAAGLERRRVTLTDVTELKKAHEDLKKSHEDLRHLNETLEEQVKNRTAELEQSNRELEAFSYSVSHDLKTPLRAIQGFSRMLLEEHTAGMDEEGRRLFQMVIDNTRLMDRLIDDLLNLARLARQPLNYFALDLTAMAKSVFERLRSQEPGRDLRFIAHDSPLASGIISLCIR
jgi:PAS domain S-box-containing protein